MGRRQISVEELTAIPQINIALPPSKHPSDPFSHGVKPDLYGADDLKKVAIEKHARTDEFEKRLMGIWWALNEEPVPYVFRTQDGTIRSLDAGCVGFLLNRWRPEIEAIEVKGVVNAVRPIGDLLDRYLPIKDRLVSAVMSKPSENKD